MVGVICLDQTHNTRITALGFGQFQHSPPTQRAPGHGHLLASHFGRQNKKIRFLSLFFASMNYALLQAVA